MLTMLFDYFLILVVARGYGKKLVIFVLNSCLFIRLLILYPWTPSKLYHFPFQDLVMIVHYSFTIILSLTRPLRIHRLLIDRIAKCVVRKTT
eukprot:SAG31_NODE_479_length_15133_cov_39.816283_4_plen_92_part_00